MKRQNIYSNSVLSTADAYGLSDYDSPMENWFLVGNDSK